jgi:hypothetical protein
MMKKILIAIGVVTIAGGILWAGKAWNNFQVSARTSRFNDQLGDLFGALQKYKERVGSYPTGSNAEIAKALNGSNSRNVIVLISARVDRNDKGEFIDPWGTPLRIYYSDTGVLIRSAGPNRRFDDSSVIECDDFIRSN